MLVKPISKIFNRVYVVKCKKTMYSIRKALTLISLDLFPLLYYM